MNPSALKTIALAGLLAGTLDGLAASLLFIFRTGKNPMIVFQFIASGVFGKDAFAAGMEWWGILFHYGIATGWTVLFFLLYSAISILQKNIVATGIGYGAVVWMGMNLVVMPLSRVQQGSSSLSNAIINVIILMLCVGLPIAWLVSRHHRERT